MPSHVPAKSLNPFNPKDPLEFIICLIIVCSSLAVIALKIKYVIPAGRKPESSSLEKKL
jgi:hypothetical protein